MRTDRYIEATWDERRGPSLEGLEEDSPERVPLHSDDEIARWLDITPTEATKISDDLIARVTREPSTSDRVTVPSDRVTISDAPHDVHQVDDEALQDARWAEYLAEEVTSDAAATTSIEDDAEASTARILASDARAGIARGTSPASVRATSNQARAAGEVAQNEADEHQRLELAAGDPSTRRGLNAVASVEARAKAQTDARAQRTPTWTNRHDYEPRHEVDAIRQEVR